MKGSCPKMGMAKAGSSYEHEAAAFFRTLGLTAEVGKRVDGARGGHDIDVWVTGKLHAFNIRWVVECKDWKKNVPKEKVLALQSIAQDVGADRAFLLSEKGFQAGAIRCARHTNIELTSLQQLREATNVYFAETEWWVLLRRAEENIRKMEQLPPTDDQNLARVRRDSHHDLHWLKDLLATAMEGKYPFAILRYHRDGYRETPVFRHHVDVRKTTTQMLEAAERYMTWGMPLVDE